MKIRRFSASDEQGVIDVILPIQREEFGIAITAEDQPDLRAIPEFYQTGDGDFWVAAAGERIVGTIALKDIGGAEAALRKMFVAPEFRGREHGVAAGLLDALLAHSERRKIEAIYLGRPRSFSPPIGSTKRTALSKSPEKTCRRAFRSWASIRNSMFVGPN